jgi:hypothetical protein
VKEEDAVYHLIEFNTAFTADLVISHREPLERLRVRPGARARACPQPYVLNTAGGPVEVADLFFEDGTVASHVPFEWFRFVE